MSSGGVFQLIANDGKADELIMATCLLKARIAQIRARRAQQGEEVTAPTLGDIERTHVLYMHASFKPFAAFGMEYRKIQPTSGVAYASELIYAIPQAGDFFSDFGVRFTTTAATTAATSTLATGTTTDGTSTFTEADNAVVAGSGLIVDDGAAVTPEIRYVSYPGERIAEKLWISVNANTLDEYSKYASASYRKHLLCEGKLAGYKRLVGQEVPVDGMSGSQMLSAQVSATGQGTAAASDTHRRVVRIVSGLQTPKVAQPAAVFWHIGRLWFANVKQQMIPSVSIPYGDRRITIQTATKAQMIGHENGGTYIETPTVAATAALVASDPAAVTAGALVSATTTVNRRKFNTANITGDVAALTDITGGDLSLADMYMNNIYVLPDVHNIFIARVGFTLIRVHRSNNENTITSGSKKLLSSLKWPIERMFFGVRPNANNDTMDNWWSYSNITSKVSRVQGRTYTTVPRVATLTEATPNTIATYAASLVVGTAVVEDFSYQLQENIASDISVELHGQPLYNAYPTQFFADYVPTVFGGCNVTASKEDPSSCMFTFSLFPGLYQPAGHLNVSRAREIYMNWTFATAFVGTTSDLILEADAINFLLISDGNAVLRYST